MFSELNPLHADCASFLAAEGKEWTNVSVLPWNADADNKSFVLVETQSEQAGWGRPFDVFNRPNAGQALTSVRMIFTPVLVRLPEVDREFVILHRNSASVSHLIKAVESFIRFSWPNFASKSRIAWFFPQLSELTEERFRDTRDLYDLSIAHFCDRFSGRDDITFPSFRVEATAGPELEEPQLKQILAQHHKILNRVMIVFQKLETNGKLSCPVPHHIGLIGENKATKVIKAWDSFVLRPRRPSQEIDAPVLEVFNTNSIKPAITRFNALPEEEKSTEVLEAALASALTNSLSRPLRSYHNASDVVRCLRLLGNVKEDATRHFLQTEVDHLLKVAGIDVAHHDPWFELTKLARNVVERIARWMALFKESPVAVPHDLLPFDPLPNAQNLNLQRRGRGQLPFEAPAGLHMAGKIVRNRTLICVSLHPVEFLVAASNIRREDFNKVAEIISTTAEAFAWDVDAYNNLLDVSNAIESNDSVLAKARWREFIETTKAMPKAKDSTSVLIVSKLRQNSLAQAVAKNVGELLLKTNESRSNQAIIRFWRNRFGEDSVVVEPPPLPPIPEQPKIANRRLSLLSPRNSHVVDTFKKRENHMFCAVKNCEIRLPDFFICPLHHRMVVNKLKEDKIATIAPRDFSDNYGARRVWAGESLPAQTPMNLNDSYTRSHYHLEALALHNPDLDLDLPAEQLRMTEVIYHTSGVDVNWGERPFWKNYHLLHAVECVNKHVYPSAFNFSEIKAPKSPLRVDLPPEGEALEWVELPGHLDHRNDPNDDFNHGKADEAIGGWKTLILRPEFAPCLGYFTTIGRQEKGATLIFRIDETGSGARKVRAPILSVIKDGRTFLVDPLGDISRVPRQCTDIVERIGFPVRELFRQMKENAEIRRKCESFYAFPELWTLANFAELHSEVKFAVAFDSVTSLQHAKNFLLRDGKAKGHSEHPNIMMFSVGKAEGEEHLPQCFFLYKKGYNYKIWRPVRPGLDGPACVIPRSYDERYEYRFICHMLATEYYPGGVTTDNLLGLLVEDLYPELQGRRRELHRDCELGAASLALFILLNDSRSLSKLNFVGGELSFTSKWQHRFHFFTRQTTDIRRGGANIRYFQEEARKNLLQQHFPQVLDVKDFLRWLKNFLPVDTRFDEEFLKKTTDSFVHLSQFPFQEEDTPRKFMREWFSEQSRRRNTVKVLYPLPPQFPHVPLRAMQDLQLRNDGNPYSQVANYENARAGMEAFFEARHQKMLEYRREVEEEERLERERLSPPPATPSSDDVLSTDSEQDSDEEFLAYAEALENAVLEPEGGFQRPRRGYVPPNDWRALLLQQRGRGRPHVSDDESIPELEGLDDENEDECPEPEEEEVRGVDDPLPRRNLPILPDAEVVPRAQAQIVEDPEFRPIPDEDRGFECKVYFPHSRYDELFTSGDADSFAEFALKTREGVRRLIEDDLQFVSHERVIRTVQAEFDFAWHPDQEEDLTSSLNLTEARNANNRFRRRLSDVDDGEVALDYERLNLGEEPQGQWIAGGEIIIPHRSDRKVRFTDEDELWLEMDVHERDDWGKSNFSFDEVAPSDADLPAVRPLPMSTYGKWRPQVQLVDTKSARSNRARLQRQPDRFFLKNMRVMGIVDDEQFIEDSDIDIIESDAEQQKILKLAQTLSDKGIGIDKRANEAADELADLIIARNTSTTLILARFCEKIGTLRGGTIRSEVRKSLTRRDKERSINFWAKSFKNKEGDLY